MGRGQVPLQTRNSQWLWLEQRIPSTREVLSHKRYRFGLGEWLDVESRCWRNVLRGGSNALRKSCAHLRNCCYPKIGELPGQHEWGC